MNLGKVLNLKNMKKEKCERMAELKNIANIIHKVTVELDNEIEEFIVREVQRNNVFLLRP